MNNRVCKKEQLRLIMECRKSGLSDYQWCEQNGIRPGSFHNWVSKLRKEGYSLWNYFNYFAQKYTKARCLTIEK